ncbi:hypothetical protein HFP51_10970 [Parasphingopyxis sp. CP4]|uniref:hypothetical protein n=1 Tax=Parasphingopyxis sp. CP4 TaxID=2724527 RepID=UPI0015A08337|nr:hypothetical protein [Parasphingopyxis sp. CP4]QLC22652.1 hypothetical protein HFP51_10970 [Parasphingopyxis sp. CP4]
MLPPKPRVIVKDIASFFARRERHNWIALFFAILIPGVVIGTFAMDSETDILPTEPIVHYVEVWGSDRTDEEIVERQRVLALEENERRAISRQRFQQLAEGSGVEYDRAAAAEADRIADENRRILLRPGERLDGGRLEIDTDGR